MAPPTERTTQFAPAQRDSGEKVQKQSRSLLGLSMLRQLLDTVPEILVILNDKRQIVFANQRLVDMLGCGDAKSLIGVRFGEALTCVHASETPGGCGTTAACQFCGAVLATLSSQKGIAAVRECRLSQEQEGQALNLKVTTTPIELEGKQYTVLSATDVSGDQRREMLERILFKGILTGAQDVGTTARGLQEAGVEALHDFRQDASRFSDTLIDEINEHRILKAAESDVLRVRPDTVHTLDLLQAVAQFYEQREETKGRGLEIHPEAKELVLISDAALLKQIVGYMVKNALEACEERETVTLNADVRDEKIEFSVRNPGFIPRDAQLQIFQRGFTTKGEGRGLGTYAMKLLSEKYLKGKVSFVSTEKVGTRFRACYPVQI